jgi:hypothetical protein
MWLSYGWVSQSLLCWVRLGGRGHTHTHTHYQVSPSHPDSTAPPPPPIAPSPPARKFLHYSLMALIEKSEIPDWQYFIILGMAIVVKAGPPPFCNVTSDYFALLHFCTNLGWGI